MAKNIDTTYYVKKGESTDAYNARIAEYRGKNSSGAGSTDTTGGTGDAGSSDGFGALLSQLQSMATTQSEAINSSPTNIESKINSAIASTKEGTAAETSRIESEFGREAGYARDKAQSEFTNFAESRSGFGTQMTAFRELVKTTDKYMADLEQRKQELILQNNSAGAAKIADLELKSLEYQEKAKQQVFNNLLSLSSFGLSAAQFDENKRQFGVTQGFAEKQLASQERQKASEIAIQYGVQMQEGDTIEDVITRAMPYASEKRQLELQSLRADIASKQAATANALAGNADEKPFDTETADLLARAALTGDTFFIEALKTNEQKKSVYKAIANQKDADMKNLQMIADQSSNDEDFREAAKFYYGSINYPVDEAALAGIIAKTEFKPKKKTTTISRDEVRNKFSPASNLPF